MLADKGCPVRRLRKYPINFEFMYSITLWCKTLFLIFICIAAGQLARLVEACSPALLIQISRAASNEANLLSKTGELLKEKMVTFDDDRTRLWSHPDGSIGLLFQAKEGTLIEIDEELPEGETSFMAKTLFNLDQPLVNYSYYTCPFNIVLPPWRWAKRLLSNVYEYAADRVDKSHLMQFLLLPTHMGTFPPWIVTV